MLLIISRRVIRIFVEFNKVLKKKIKRARRRNGKTGIHLPAGIRQWCLTIMGGNGLKRLRNLQSNSFAREADWF